MGKEKWKGLGREREEEKKVGHGDKGKGRGEWNLGEQLASLSGCGWGPTHAAEPGGSIPTKLTTPTHSSSNRAQCRLTTLIEANAITTTLRRHPRYYCTQPPAADIYDQPTSISWLYRAVGKLHLAVGLSLWQARRSGTHYRPSFAVCPSVLATLDARWGRYCSRDISALSAIEMLCIIMRYINFLFYSILFYSILF